MNKKRIHFIGIGGIGISALARYYLVKGYTVTGSDDTMGENINLLRSNGVTIYEGLSQNNIVDTGDYENIDRIIYSVAVPSNGSEMMLAKRLSETHDFPLLSYPEGLSDIIQGKRLIAISGTHGKTTTTALCYHALMNAGLNVSAIMGSLIDTNSGRTNYLYNDFNKDKEEYIIIEACEYRRHFLNYYPDYLLITNIDEDHLDYYKDIKDIQLAFWQFINNIHNNGVVLLHKDNYSHIVSQRLGIINRIKG
ncbi:MAG: Mur ligase family protein [Cyanobium sp. MAG06]|nr:Mur ligase family protein [Cyanobium sp. MAG06]